MLRIENLEVGYQRDLQILRGVTLEANTGWITAILGANGVGKSTLLKTVAGFLKPAAGSILLDGKELAALEPHELIAEGVAYLPQDSGVVLDMSVEENLLLGAWTFRRDRARIQAKLADSFKRFPDLAPKRRQHAGALSGGQRRMVEFARALMSDPQVLLIDEPTAGLSLRVSAEVYEMLRGLRAEGRTILLVDQQIKDAVKLSDYVYVLDVGKNRREGSASEFTDLKASFWW